MATENKNLSEYEIGNIPNGADFRIGIVVSEWNNDITSNLLKGALEALTENGVLRENILVKNVPGTFELPLGCQYLLEHDEELDGVIAIGCVIQGETKHFDFVCQGATKGIMDVTLEYNTPISFCVLTDNTKQQSIDRSGGKHGNKGIECAVSLLKMIGLQEELN
ncbi:6,7-dimethyl-8-ribityllumazine synthase [Crocinitomix algicola]|uniref:6,7-dimethyl-8-ribityllumazine synthase n=1 Tax=Crocinitomix algicola TaxID=1740263 RepID=UPI00082ADE2A|nr:6,7-dimethyl-8-ribityllumazine synthase [Crocinitomix algicola]